jgi:hypothetical protein
MVAIFYVYFACFDTLPPSQTTHESRNLVDITVILYGLILQTSALKPLFMHVW